MLPRLDQLAWLVVPLVVLSSAVPADGATTLGSICRVKGQEDSVLQGLGIVVGLNGTGDGGDYLPTVRSLAMAMELMGNPVGATSGAASRDIKSELKDTKNVALVIVTAVVPAGAREGDRLDCVVSSIGTAKSLEGGRLFLTALLGPVPEAQRRVYAFAQGPVSLDDPALATTGRIHDGCRLVEDFPSLFAKDGKITLVLDENHADFQVAQEVANVVNYEWRYRSGQASPAGATGGAYREQAKAVDQFNIEIDIPPEYRDHLVSFVSQILSLPLLEQPKTAPRVVINQRSGSIVIGGDVEIGAVLVTHKNVHIETGGAADAAQFVPLDPSDPENPKLKSLVAALDALRVPKEDIIDIIKGLDRNGKLHAQLIIE